MPAFCSKSMKCEWLKSPVKHLCSGFSGMTTFTQKVEWKGFVGAQESQKGSIWITRTLTFTDVKQQYRPVWRFRFGGSGNAVLFVLSEHCVSSWFSMLVEEWGLHRPPLLKVFHRGESSDVHGIQRVCHFCLWRRWNNVLCFTTIRLIGKTDSNWFKM